MLQVEGKKMSKSLGNFFTVRDLLDQGVPGEVIRFVLLGTHYSKPMDWTAEKAAQAEATLRHWHDLTRDAEERDMVDDVLVEALSDDLNTAGAVARLHALAKAISANPQKDCHVEKSLLLASGQFLGLLASQAGDWGRSMEVDLSQLEGALDALRESAKLSKDFSSVDAMKAALIAAGVEVRMSKAGVELMPGPGFDAEKLPGLGR